MWSLLTCIAEQTLTLTWFCIFCKTNTDSFCSKVMVIVQVREQVVAAPQSTLQNFQGRSDICFILPSCLHPGKTVVCLVSSQHWQNIQHTQVFTPLSESAVYVESLSVLLLYHLWKHVSFDGGCSVCCVEHHIIFSYHAVLSKCLSCLSNTLLHFIWKCVNWWCSGATSLHVVLPVNSAPVTFFLTPRSLCAAQQWLDSGGKITGCFVFIKVGKYPVLHINSWKKVQCILLI